MAFFTWKFGVLAVISGICMGWLDNFFGGFLDVSLFLTYNRARAEKRSLYLDVPHFIRKSMGVKNSGHIRSLLEGI